DLCSSVFICGGPGLQCSRRAGSAAGGRFGSRPNRLVRLAVVNELQPSVLVGSLAVDDVEERLLDGLGDRPAAAVADRDLVDGLDRRDLDGGAGEERLV